MSTVRACERSRLGVFVLSGFMFVFLFLSILIFSMAKLRIGTLNVNGARKEAKRASLFQLREVKGLDVMLLQETHSTKDNEMAWKREGGGEVFLSHDTSTSGGVGFLFSGRVLPQSFEVEEVVVGRLLKVRALWEHVSATFINVYAPTRGADRVAFLDRLAEVISNCNCDEYLFLGGDFNCTADGLDRNHQEPHPASRRRLLRLIEAQELCDVWRRFHHTERSYTWAHARDDGLSLARLDRFYCFRHHFGAFDGCSVSPVGFSDHWLVHCSVLIQNVKPRSAYWHFNTALLQDNNFTEGFAALWAAHRRTRAGCHSLQEWWEVGKTKVKQFCQHYARNVTRDKVSSLQALERVVGELQDLAASTGDRGHIETLKDRTAALASLLGVSARGALVRSRFRGASEMDVPSQFFFGLERKNGQRRFIHSMRSDSGEVLTEAAAIRRHAVGFYKGLFRSEFGAAGGGAACFL